MASTLRPGSSLDYRRAPPRFKKGRDLRLRRQVQLPEAATAAGPSDLPARKRPVLGVHVRDDQVESEHLPRPGRIAAE